MYLGKGKQADILFVFLIFSISAFGQAGKSFKYHFNGNLQKSDVISGSRSLLVNYSLPELNIENISNYSGTFYRISIPGHSRTADPGKPELPVLSRLITIPEKCSLKIRITDIKSVKIDPSDNDFKGFLYPAQEGQTKQSENKKTDFVIDRKLYRTKGLIRSDTVSVVNLGKVRGQQLANLIISPVRYNPVSNFIEVITSMKIEISFTDNYSPTARSLSSESPLFNTALEKSVMNYYQSDLITGYSDKPVEMIILTDTTFRKFLKPLFTWKTQKGFKLDILYRGEGETGLTYSELKESISKIYNAGSLTGHPPEYLLIIGDADKIPSYGSGYVTDMYYGEFDGNGDYLPDLFIGRIPSTDTTSVKSAVQKIIQYERFEFADTNKFYSNALVLAGKDQNYADYMNGQVNYAVTNYLNAGNKINESHFYYPDGYTKKDSVLKLISKGLSFINYTGHGSSSAWLHLDIKSTDVNKLNNRNMYPFVISNACRTAAFNDTTSLGDKMVNASLKGAIGFIGCTNDSYWDEDYNWAVGAGMPTNNPKYSETGLGAYDRLFHTHGELPSDWFTTMGQVNYAGNLAVSASSSVRKKYYWETYTLLGDPSLIPMTGTPQPFSGSLPDTLPNGIKSFAFTVDPFAYVAVSHSDTLWDASFAGPSGAVNLKLPGLSNTSCLLVITGQNRKPLIRTIYISNINKEYVALTDPGLNDASGNNNGKADFGETVHLNLKISNLGRTDANNLTASISSTSPWVSVGKNVAAIGTLKARSDTVLNKELELTIGNNVHDLGIITVDLILKDNKYEKKYKIDITVHAPHLEIKNCLIDDSAAGNNNSIADPGETFNLIFQVRNLGSSNTSGQFSVESLDNDLIILDQNVKSGLLQFGETSDIIVTVKLSESAHFGDFIKMSTMLDCNPFIENRDFTIRVGRIRESFESASFRVFPWINVSLKPWIINTLSPVDGNLSARSGFINHNGTSTLMIRSYYPSPDSLKFYYRVSSESGYDFFQFKLNDNEVIRNSGETSWIKETVAIPAGINRMEWTYKKDNSVSQGADAAWIDLIDFSLSTPIDFIQRDLEMARIVSPVQKEIYGQELISAKVQNIGTDTLKGFNLAYSINGQSPVTQFFRDKLAPYQDSLTVTFDKKADMGLNGKYRVSIYGLNNNDDYLGNDTLYISVENTRIEETLKVYPNPFTDKLNLNLNSTSVKVIHISLTSISGKRITDITTEIFEGENDFLIDTKNLAPSLYILTIYGQNFSKALPLIKLRE